MKPICLFDFDDTLVKTRETRFRGIRLILEREFGVEADHAFIERAWGLPYDEFLLTLVEGDHEKKGILKKAYEDLGREYMPPPFPDALDLIGKLKGIRMGIITASSRRLVEEQLEGFGVYRECFEFVLAADDTLHHKPDPRVFLPAFKILNLSPKEARRVLYVGDSLNDLFAARGFGTNFLGIARQEREAKAFELFNGQYIRNMEGVEAILDRMEKEGS